MLFFRDPLPSFSLFVKAAALPMAATNSRTAAHIQILFPNISLTPPLFFPLRKLEDYLYDTLLKWSKHEKYSLKHCSLHINFPISQKFTFDQRT